MYYVHIASAKDVFPSMFPAPKRDTLTHLKYAPEVKVVVMITFSRSQPYLNYFQPGTVRVSLEFVVKIHRISSHNMMNTSN